MEMEVSQQSKAYGNGYPNFDKMKLGGYKNPLMTKRLNEQNLSNLIISSSEGHDVVLPINILPTKIIIRTKTSTYYTQWSTTSYKKPC
jgi:hypothetical protein